MYLNKSINPTVYLYLNIYILIFLTISYYTYKGCSFFFFWNHFKLSNFNLPIVLIFLLMNLLYLLVCRVIKVNEGLYKSDFFFAILNLSILLPALLFVNNLFTFFFFLELNSSIIIYKFITTNCWKSKMNNLFYNKMLPQNYTNMLFFQYWSAFFSSVLFVYVIITYIFIYGDISWFYINYLNYISNYNYTYIPFIKLIVLNFVLIFSFFIKIGMTPLHLYKIEIYKGLSYIAIFFYTTFYFLIFFSFFLIMLTNYLSSIVFIYWYFFIIFIFFGSLYSINLFFNINLIKNFFAYSTIINSLGFLSATTSLLML